MVIESPSQLVKNLPSIYSGKINNNSIVIMVMDENRNVLSSKLMSAYSEWVDVMEEMRTLLKGNKTNNIIVCFVTNDDSKKGKDVRPVEYEYLADRLFAFVDFVHILDILYIRNNRWGSLICFDEFCCPKEGTEIK